MVIYNIFWLTLLILFEASALYFIKNYSIHDNTTWFLILSIISYAMIPYCLYRILKNGEGIAIINIIWNVASTLYGLFIGVILFSEHLTTPQKVGATLGTLGTVLMMWNSD